MNDRARHSPDADPLPLRLARWFEARLHDTLDVPERFDPSTACRLYGFEILDPHGFVDLHGVPARVTFLAAAERLDDLLCHPGAARVAEFDAIALVSSEWLLHSLVGPDRPNRFPIRRRARVVEVRHPEGGATIARFEHEPDQPVVRSAA